MTPEEIDNLEAGREMDARIAHHVFGWYWRVSKDRKLSALVPPPNEPNGWEAAFIGVTEEINAKMYSVLDHWPEKAERFSDWDRACIKHHPNGYNFETGIPGFSTDVAAAWGVVEAMKTKGVEIMLWSDSAGITSRFHTYERMEESCSASAPLSICRAALKFVFAEKDTPCQT